MNNTFSQYGSTAQTQYEEPVDGSSYSTPQPIGRAEGYTDPESTREALLKVGQAYNQGGVGSAVKAYQGDPNLVATLQRDPRILASIANNPNPRNESPDSMAVNALAGAFYKTDVIKKLVTSNGMDERVLQDPKAAPPGLWDQLKGVFTNAQAKPGSPEQIANEAYFGALTRGGGIPAATQAYSQTYIQAVQGQQQLTNTQLTKALDYGLKKADIASNAQRVSYSAAKSLAGSGLSGDEVSGLSNEIGMIVAQSKDNPQVAVARSQALIQQLIEQNAPQSVINKISTQLAPHIKLEGDQAKMYDEISKYDLSQGVLNRFKFGLTNDSDLKQINRARETYQRKENRIKAEGKLEEELLTKTDPRLIAAEVVKKYGTDVANELAKQNAQRIEYGLPPMSMAEYDKEANRIMTGRPSITAQPTSTSAAPSSGTTSPSAAVQPLSTEPVAPAPPITLATAKAQQEGRKNEAEAAGTILGKETGSITSTLSEINTVREILDSGEHNVGTTVTGVIGRGPIAQAIGSQFETRDAANTKMIGDIINAIAAEGVKALGTQPTDADLKFWTENKPKIGGDPEYMRQWLEKAEARLKNRVSTAQQQVTGRSSTNPKPVSSQSQPKVRVYNPNTGALE